MTLKIIRFSLPKSSIEKLGLTDLFTVLDHLEVLNFYQYDAHNIFSLHRIRFKPNRIADFDKIFREKLNAEYYEVLCQQSDEITCIIKQKRDTAFFNMSDQGPAAILCPIILREDGIQGQLLAEEQYLANIFEVLSKYTDSWKVNYMSNIEGMKDLDQFGQLQTASPSFTAKQRDIATFAAQNGYFRSPKRISGKKIAAHFGITISAINMHLRNAGNLAMAFFFGRS